MNKTVSMLKIFIFSILLITSVQLINSCSSDDSPAPTTSAEVIGAGGGELTGSDGIVTINVPAGAVDANTTVSIQLTDEVAPNGIGKIYTLTPEGTQFTEPVSLSFQYT